MFCKQIIRRLSTWDNDCIFRHAHQTDIALKYTYTVLKGRRTNCNSIIKIVLRKTTFPAPYLY